MFKLKNIFHKKNVSEIKNESEDQFIQNTVFKKNFNYYSKTDKLYHYISNNDILNIKKVIQDGADIHNENDYPFVLIIKHNNFELVKYFVEVGIDVNNDINETIHFAIYNYKQNIDSSDIIIYLYNNCNYNLLDDENKKNLNNILREYKLKKLI